MQYPHSLPEVTITQSRGLSDAHLKRYSIYMCVYTMRSHDLLCSIDVDSIRSDQYNRWHETPLGGVLWLTNGVQPY